MALLRCDFFSDVLALSTSMTVILPQRTQAQIGMTGTGATTGSPVLYLLHGNSDDDTIWTRRTSIERYVSTLGLTVVMPRVERSFYSDEAHGGRYWTFLSEELPAIVGDFFTVSTAREDTFVAGLSMGGYGAFKWALRQPERFAAAASLSGALDVAGRDWSAKGNQRRRVFGKGDIAGTDDDVLHLIEASGTASLPSLYVACGLQDPLLVESERFLARAANANVEVATSFSDGGHEWGYWDARIQDVLAWLPLRASGRPQALGARQESGGPQAPEA